MNDNNEKRLIANQICYELYQAGDIEQLDLLRSYCATAIKRLETQKPKCK